MNLSVQVEYVNNLPDLITHIRANAARTVLEQAEGLRDKARDEAPVRTGELRDSIIVQVIDEFHYLVIVGAPHAVFVNNGTRKRPANAFFDRAVAMQRSEWNAVVPQLVK